MALKLQYDRIDWDDPEVAATLKKYRETIDAASPLMKDIDEPFSQEETAARQTAFFQALEKYKV
jgi:hypothetical protein